MEYVLGFLIAAAVGLTGFGGGVLAVPLLITGLNVPVVEAVGTSLVFVTATKLVAMQVYWRRGQMNWPVAARLLAGGAPGVIGGSLLLRRMNTEALQPVVLALVGTTIAAMALLSLWKCWRSRASAAGPSRERLLPWLAFPIGVEVGFSSAGAGALGSLVLMECTTIPAAQIIGTDLIFGVGLSALGGGLHLATGEFNAALLGKLCAGGLLGAWLGARLGTSIPARPLRAGLCVVLVGLGGHLGWRGLAVLAR